MPIKRIDLKETQQYTLIEYNDVLSTSTPARKNSQIGEIVIDTGGDPNNPQLYIANISGSLNPVGGGGGNGSPAGPTYSVQYNLLGSFGGNSAFTFNPSSSLLTVPNLTIAGTANLGSNATVKITGGNSGQFLRTDGNGNLTWANASGGNGTPGGSNTQVQFNDAGAFGASANLTWNGNTLSASSVYVPNTISVQNGIKTVDNANRIMTEMNWDFTGPVRSGYLQFMSVDTGNSNATATINIGVPLTPQFAASGGYSLTLPDNEGSNGQVLTTDGTGNLRWANSGAVLVTSNISNLQAGLPLLVATSSNAQYPGGIFTLYQSASPASLTMTNQWASGGTSKAAYLGNGDVNTQNVSVTLSLVNSSFNVQSSDIIAIGNSNVTGANLLSLGISGSGGTYNIPSTYFSNAVQIAASTTVTANLSIIGGNTVTANGNTLTTTGNAPAFTFTGVTGTFASSSVPYWLTGQTLSWAATGVVGTVTGGNVNVVSSGNTVTTLTTTGQTSGTSASFDSSLANLTIVATYSGTPNGGGNTTTVGPITSNLTSVTTYQPLFSKITTTGGNANPNFTTSDTYIPSQYVAGPTQGANTVGNVSQWMWMALPASSPTPVFKFDQPPFIGIVVTPDQTYSNVNIGGVAYNAHGFTNFNGVAFIYTV